MGALPQDIKMDVAVDRTITIRASLTDVERTVLIAILLVVGVVAVFLMNGRAVLIPSVAVAVSLLGTLGVMFLLGFSLDNLSLMALTISTGFVVDDAIVVLENVTRHVEAGMDRFEAALQGAQEVGFTVLSISISLIAVFLPILLMGGIYRAPVPRVRHHAVGRGADLAGDLADHHADDGRLPGRQAEAVRGEELVRAAVGPQHRRHAPRLRAGAATWRSTPARSCWSCWSPPSRSTSISSPSSRRASSRRRTPAR